MIYGLKVLTEMSNMSRFVPVYDRPHFESIYVLNSGNYRQIGNKTNQKKYGEPIIMCEM